MTAVRLSHPWRWHNTLDVVDVPDDEAARLIRSGTARPVSDLITPVGGGMFSVELANPRRTIRRRGYDAALLSIKANR